MEDMLPETSAQGLPSAGLTSALDLPKALGNLLYDHKGEDVIVLDLREPGSWTDFFVIATAASDTHMDGLERHIKEFCNEREIEILRKSRKPTGLHGVRWNDADDAAGIGAANTGRDEWRIIDLGPTVIHLMSLRARKFYELERLYSMAAAVPVLPAAGGLSAK
jgi:ribosome-associated protein